MTLASSLLKSLLITVRNMGTGFLIVLVVLAGLVVLARVLRWEDAFIYFPDHETFMTPADLGLAYEEVRFGEEGRLHGWFVPGRTDVTILWFHGNASNLSHPGRVEFIRLMHDRLGVGFFIFDYRGYGQSEGRSIRGGPLPGRPGRAGILCESREDVNPDRIVYYGRSLGGAVASHLATEEPPYRLVLESAFSSAPDMAQVVFPFLPVRYVVTSRFSNRDHLAGVHAPVLIIHGDGDDQVPVKQADTLYAIANEPKQLYIVRGADHNDVHYAGGEPYLETFAAFLDLPLAPA